MVCLIQKAESLQMNGTSYSKAEILQIIYTTHIFQQRRNRQKKQIDRC